MRYATKPALVRDIRAEHDALTAIVNSLPASLLHQPGVWGDGWTAGDLLSHLAEWHRMCLAWHRDGLAGLQPEIPAPGYKYRELPRLNRDIQRKYRDRSFADSLADFESTYQEILELVRSLPPRALFTPGHFAWTKKNPLTTYVGANTASHYRFAIKVLRRWLRQIDFRN